MGAGLPLWAPTAPDSAGIRERVLETKVTQHGGAVTVSRASLRLPPWRERPPQHILRACPLPRPPALGGRTGEPNTVALGAFPSRALPSLTLCLAGRGGGHVYLI